MNLQVMFVLVLEGVQGEYQPGGIDDVVSGRVQGFPPVEHRLARLQSVFMRDVVIEVYHIHGEQ